jgi:hypothetical protein
MKTHVIYAFVDGEGKFFYVGKTSDIKTRKQAHLYEVKKGNKLPKYHKLRKLLNAGSKFEDLLVIIEDGLSCENVDAREIHHIKRLREEGYKLRNLTDGGEGNPNPSPEIIEKGRLARIGQKRTEETRKKMSESRMGMKFSEEHKANLSKAWKTRPPFTKETLEKKSKTTKGRVNIKKYELTDPFGDVYITENGLTAFCEEQGLSRSTLFKAAKGKIPNYKGWTMRKLE